MTKSRGIHRYPRQYWSAAHETVLRIRYATQTAREIGALLGRHPASVYTKAKKLGLTKAEGTVAAVAKARLAADPAHASRAHRFPKGHVPWNKGTHYVAGGRSADTRFKPGQRGNNWRPIGSLRINADGYLDRKVTDTGYPPRDWQAVHRLVWEAAHGPVPTGHCIAFKPGRRTTDEALITLDAVECITRTEMMSRNTIHNRYPKDVARCVQLRGAITRQINRRLKAAEKAPA